MNGTTLYGISDLPPHPAGDLNKTYPATPYQIDPHGYVEQNLYASWAVTTSPEQVKNNGDVPNKEDAPAESPSNSVPSNPSPSDTSASDTSTSNTLNSKSSTLKDCDRVKSDGFTYSNPGAKDSDPQGTELGISDGAESGYETIDLGDSPEGPEGRRDSFVLANPAATKEYV